MIWLGLWLAMIVAMATAFAVLMRVRLGPRHLRSIRRQRNAIARMDSADWPQW